MKATIGREGQGLGRGEGLELLHPAERGGPDQPVEAHARIGDQPQGVADPEEGGPEGGGLATGGGQLAGHGTDGEEHDGGGHHGQGEVERGSDGDLHARGQSREDRDDRRDRPQRDDAGAEPPSA